MNTRLTELVYSILKRLVLALHDNKNWEQSRLTSATKCENGNEDPIKKRNPKQV